MDDPSENGRFMSEIQRIGISSVYLYLTATDFAARTPQIKTLVARLRRARINAYGMDGARAYFSDSKGPGALFASAGALLLYNEQAEPEERFVGFMMDMEPQDGPDGHTFHNGVAESRLDPAQLADRDKLMADWLTIHRTMRDKMNGKGLRLASSLPFWTDSYNGEALLATFNGTRENVTHHLMRLVDDYAIMSYNTDPAGIAKRVISKLIYADTLTRPPRVFGGVETKTGNGRTISYGDTPPKNSKTAVLADMDVVVRNVSSYRSFAGMNIHSWTGWRDLPPETAGTKFQ
jgi:hypothetical protein